MSKVDTLLGICFLMVMVFIIVFLANVLFVYIPLLILHYFGVTGFPAMVIMTIIAFVFGFPFAISNIRRGSL